MTVKRKFGKNEIEVSGTEAQVEKAVSQWLEEVKTEEPMVTLSRVIRAKGELVFGDEAKSAPIVDVLNKLLGMTTP